MEKVIVSKLIPARRLDDRVVGYVVNGLNVEGHERHPSVSLRQQMVAIAFEGCRL